MSAAPTESDEFRLVDQPRRTDRVPVRTSCSTPARACPAPWGCARPHRALRRRAPGLPELISELSGLGFTAAIEKQLPGCRSTPGRRSFAPRGLPPCGS
ncbi:hypothetical protein HBB16_17790 [Pseudonocardia sp. MCCB 268]|nr:hypothetical protein [Pseudonocardia cytotoxica]